MACHTDFITPDIDAQFTDLNNEGFTVKLETTSETWARGYADYAQCKAGTCMLALVDY